MSLNLSSPALAPLAAVLLDHAAAADAQRHACESISASCLAQLPALVEAATALPDGLALSPADAGRCLLDAVRTAKLLQAVDRSVRARLLKQSQLEVLYAGCGPLAPLALLLAPMFPAERVRFSLIDIHPPSLACARRLFEAAGAADSLQHLLCTDAARTRLPSAMRPDILVVELMQQALSQEPQLAVTANLLPQCQADALIVPKRITVSACLADPGMQQPQGDGGRRIELGELLTLSRESLPLLASQIAQDASSLPVRSLQVPWSAPPGLHLMLATSMETCDGLLLHAYESGLTHPRFQLALGAIAPGTDLHFRYALGPQPGFHCWQPTSLHRKA